jgi:hypothetical protein
LLGRADDQPDGFGCLIHDANLAKPDYSNMAVRLRFGDARREISRRICRADPPPG